MKVFVVIVVAALTSLIFFFENSVLAAEPAEINGLMEFTLRNVMPQQGPGGGAMFVLPAEHLPRPYGYENIFFRVHDGGNRFYVTIFRKEIHIQPNGGIIVKSMKFIDGGSILSGKDEWGAPDGRPDRVVFNEWQVAPHGLILEEAPETFIDLVPGAKEYEKYLKLFDEGIAEIKKFYGISGGCCE